MAQTDKKAAFSSLLRGMAPQPARVPPGRARALAAVLLRDKRRLLLIAAGLAAIVVLVLASVSRPQRRPEVVMGLPPPQPAAPAVPAPHSVSPETATAHKDLAIPAPPAGGPVAGEGTTATAQPLPASVEPSGQPTVQPPAQPGAADAAPPAAEAIGQPAAAAAASIALGAVVVTRGSNLRADASIEAAVVAFVRAGERLQVLDDKPVRGYYRVAHGARKGWVWGLNIAPIEADPKPAN